MPRLIFDIETVGEDFASLDATSQESLTRWITQSSKNEVEYQLGLKNLKEGIERGKKTAISASEELTQIKDCPKLHISAEEKRAGKQRMLELDPKDEQAQDYLTVHSGSASESRVAFASQWGSSSSALSSSSVSMWGRSDASKGYEMDSARNTAPDKTANDSIKGYELRS